ncbi:MAG: gfo/Idh/MocA family oxidoreductase, partial [Planctomycetota bacterium]|nr:gfo/Idh/MocA family oxidoreductase [Planctomycetota bacterium]
YFRPEQLKYAIDKNKHVFCEKPVAVDAPGVRSVLASCEEAKKKSLNVVSGLCYRYHLPKRETYKRIHEGEIGDVRAIYTTYYTGPLWHHGRKDNWTDMEWQVRNWIYFNWLSGDHIAEQHIHSLDKASWALKDETPVACVGAGGRQVRTEPKFGDVFDHFNVMYEYASGPMVFAGCRQMAGCYNDVNDIVIGTTGKADIQRNLVNGKNIWRNKENPNPNMYDQEHAELFAAIRSGNPINNGQYMANSTLMALMGRMSAYTGQRITWEKAMNSNVKLGPEVVELGPAPAVVLPVPGINTLS